MHTDSDLRPQLLAEDGGGPLGPVLAAPGSGSISPD